MDSTHINKNSAWPMVSIITVNYNQPEVTAEFLTSLKKVSYPSLEVIVVDNGSTKGISEEIKALHPGLIVIKSPQNLGFAGGNNKGIASSKGEYLLFLNNDTEVDPGFIEPLIETFRKNPKIGMVCAKLVYFNSKDKNTIQYAGGHGINPYTGRGGARGYMEVDKGQYNDVSITNHPHGAAMMVPASVVRQCGLMPEIYFLYYEELDWAENIKRHGYQLYYCGLSKVYHKESVSTGKNTPLKMYYMTRGRLLFVRRNFRGFQKAASLLFFIFLSIPKNSISLLMKRHLNLFIAFTRGWWWQLFHFKIKGNPQWITGAEGKAKIQYKGKININSLYG